MSFTHLPRLVLVTICTQLYGFTARARARFRPGIDQRLPPAHGGGGAGRIAVHNPPVQRPKAHSQATVSEDRGRRGAVLRRG
eukprot:SAG31_NODE_13886_length_839_cov_2.477027_2_plen_81_part_01